jgi:hypothetical protein
LCQTSREGPKAPFVKTQECTRIRGVSPWRPLRQCPPHDRVPCGGFWA